MSLPLAPRRRPLYHAVLQLLMDSTLRRPLLGFDFASSISGPPANATTGLLELTLRHPCQDHPQRL
jgi:hypothetical protein